MSNRGDDQLDDPFAMSRTTLARLFDYVDEAVLCLDEDGTIRFATRGMHTMLGYDPSALPGRNVVELVHPDDLPHVIEALARWTGRAGTPRGEVVRVVTTDGGWRAMRYDAVIGHDTPALGHLIITLALAAEVDSHHRDLQSRVLSGDRIIGLASAFLSVGLEDFDGGLTAALEVLGGLDWVTRTSVWVADRDRPDRVNLRATWTAPSDAPTGQLPTRLRMSDHPWLVELAAGNEMRLAAPWFADEVGGEAEPVADGTAAARQALAGAGLVSLLAFPMTMAGTFTGAVVLESTLRDVTDDATHATSLRAAAAIISQALVRHEAERQLVLQARRDRTTGLPNRWALDEAMGHALDRLAAGGSAGVGLGLFDLDRFKLVNDAHGHVTGDRVLTDLAQRLASATPSGTSVFRLGGDELVALVEGATGPEDVRLQLAPLIDVLRSPLDAGGNPVVLTASVGVVHTADPTVDGGELLRRADLAMYRAKDQGGDAVAFYDPLALGDQAQQLRVESELRRALEGEGTDELEVHYQGEWDLESGALLGAEALVRWRHPTDGLLTAGAFVPVAEASGLIDRLGHLVLHTACRAAAAWVATAGPEGFLLRVNVASRQLRQPDLVDQVDDALRDAGLPAEALCLELTESTILADPTAAAKALEGLRSLGVGLAIDDFGTGYSSVLQLKQLPLTALKVDRSFVAGLPDDAVDRAIVGTTVQLAHSMGLTATAEGVETEAQRAALLELGCTRAQGFLLGRPEPEADFARRLG